MKKALSLEPKNGAYWNALGVLLHRTLPALGQHAFITAIKLNEVVMTLPLRFSRPSFRLILLSRLGRQGLGEPRPALPAARRLLAGRAGSRSLSPPGLPALMALPPTPECMV